MLMVADLAASHFREARGTECLDGYSGVQVRTGDRGRRRDRGLYWFGLAICCLLIGLGESDDIKMDGRAGMRWVVAGLERSESRDFFHAFD